MPVGTNTVILTYKGTVGGTFSGGSGTCNPGQFPVINTVTLSNITVTTAKGFGIYIHGLSNAKDSAINMTNISLSSTKGASIDQFTNSTFNKVTFTSNTQSTVWTVTNTSVFSCVSCSPSYP